MRAGEAADRAAAGKLGAEMFIGADSGLGNRIINSQQVMNVRDMYASILAAGALGYALNILFLMLERKIVHWSGR